jgi:hypothetical protein
MRLTVGAALLLTAALVGCGSLPQPYEPDAIDVTLPAPFQGVRAALEEILLRNGYKKVEWKDDETLTTGYRDEAGGPWNWLLYWRFGTVKSRVEALVTPEDDHTTRLRLQVLSKGKDGIFRKWETASPGLPQQADNHLRLIKNALHIL